MKRLGCEVCWTLCDDFLAEFAKCIWFGNSIHLLGMKGHMAKPKILLESNFTKKHKVIEHVAIINLVYGFTQHDIVLRYEWPKSLFSVNG
jgi:hypothetical protein